MPDEKRDIVQDRVLPGLTLRDRSDIRLTTNQLVRMLDLNDVRPEVAYTALLNVLGALIGTRMVDDAPTLIARAQQLLPLYVESYRIKEKQI